MKSDREILKERARVLARPVGKSAEAEEQLAIVEFKLADERYAVEQSCVREVQTLTELTPLPCTPDFLPGIINVRGQILPVLDIRRFFDLPQRGITDIHQVIIVHVDDVEVGLLADAVTAVRSIAVDAMQPSLPTLTGIRARYLRGVTEDRLVVLDARSILTDPKIVVDEQVQA